MSITMDIPVKKLIDIAREAKEMAYAPYSNFRVGAAVLSAGGNFYKGCNIENSSYSLSICAERVALFKALSEGEKKISAIAVISDREELCIPCGSCLQVLTEFDPQIKIYLCNNAGEYNVQTVEQLLPFPFRFK